MKKFKHTNADLEMARIKTEKEKNLGNDNNAANDDNNDDNNDDGNIANDNNDYQDSDAESSTAS